MAIVLLNGRALNLRTTMENFWDLRYSEPGFVYGPEPNVFFRQEIDRMEPGRILLPGEGEGRNAIYAAKSGWEVLAFDQSSVGRRKALDRAERENLRIRYLKADLAEFDCGGNVRSELEKPEKGFDVIALIYIHMPPGNRTAVHRRLMECLKPGGRLILESYHADQLDYGTGGPPVRELLYTREDLLGDFRQMNILNCEHRVVERQEGPYHSGKSSIIQLTATR